MKKKKIKKILLMVLLSVCLFTTGCKQKKNYVETFPERVNKLESYKLKGKLESNFPSGTKESNITVYYQKPNLFRVELVMPNCLEKQVIIKNNDGVYVLLPSLNKNFKVSSDWPLTSSYPYLLQSLSKDIIADENATKEILEDTTTITLEAKLFDNASKTKQKIVFDNKTGYPNKVSIYKEDNTPIMNFTVESIETDIKLDQNLFVNEVTMQTLKELYDENKKEFDRSLTYPTYCPTGLTLKDEITTGTKDNKRILLTYGGPSFVTIVESYVSSHDNIKTEYVNGDICIMGGIAFIVGATSVSFYENGVEYLVASTDTNKLDLIWMGDSLRSTDEK